MFHPQAAFFDRLSFRLDLATRFTNQELNARRIAKLRAIAANQGNGMAISPTLQGLGKKIAQFKHDVEFEAAKVSTAIDGAVAETTTAFTGVHSMLEGHKQDLADVLSSVADITQATNGGPHLDTPKTDEPANPPALVPTFKIDPEPRG